MSPTYWWYIYIYICSWSWLHATQSSSVFLLITSQHYLEKGWSGQWHKQRLSVILLFFFYFKEIRIWGGSVVKLSPEMETLWSATSLENTGRVAKNPRLLRPSKQPTCHLLLWKDTMQYCMCLGAHHGSLFGKKEEKEAFSHFFFSFLFINSLVYSF